eukprot:1157371-Pelagomonas_calceolata.AAC.5
MPLVHVSRVGPRKKLLPFSQRGSETSSITKEGKQSVNVTGSLQCTSLAQLIGFGRYTDDTQMTLYFMRLSTGSHMFLYRRFLCLKALARSLVVYTGRVDPGQVAKAYAADFDPARGYGGSTQKSVVITYESKVLIGVAVVLDLEDCKASFS